MVEQFRPLFRDAPTTSGLTTSALAIKPGPAVRPGPTNVAAHLTQDARHDALEP